MISAEDVFTALNELDFDKYEEELRDFLRNYNAEKEDLAQQKRSKAVAIKTAQPIEIAIEEDEECKDDGEDEEMGGLKRIKTD